MSKQNAPAAANALCKLWSATADTLTTEQLEWFSNLEEFAQMEADNIAVALYETASLLDNAGKGAAPTSERMSAMLYSLSHQVDTVASLFGIASDATYRIDHAEDVEARRKARSEG